jgi:hypothetical protein
MCNLAGMYLMFSSELPLYDELGLERFWHLPDWDPLNVRRKPLRWPAERSVAADRGFPAGFPRGSVASGGPGD